jgi:PLP dependent protein
MSDLAGRIAENVACVRERIAAAAARAGRDVAQVTLVAVTKYVGPAEIRALVAAGCTELGESRPQQLWQRAAELADLPIRWHLIGHLQRNKVRRTLPLVSLIHSLDSPRLATEINTAAGDCPHFAGTTPEKWGLSPSAGTTPEKWGLSPSTAATAARVPVLLEVNVSGEPAKHGFAVAEVEPALTELAALKNLQVRGLMCMAGLEGDLDQARREFAALWSLAERLRPNCPPGIVLAELSMGMSGDFEAAIAEGATLVRIGSALFEGVAASG